MLPAQLRHGPGADLMAGESGEADNEIVQLLALWPVLASQVMAGIGNVEHPYVVRNAVPIKIERVRGPVEIVGAVDDQFRHGQTVAVSPRIDHVQKALAGRCLGDRQQSSAAVSGESRPLGAK